MATSLRFHVQDEPPQCPKCKERQLILCRDTREMPRWAHILGEGPCQTDHEPHHFLRCTCGFESRELSYDMGNYQEYGNHGSG